jgi:putative drug exporter of the RND superfamily
MVRPPSGTRGADSGGNSMLQGIARLAIAAPKRIIGIAVLVFLAAAIFGIPVAESLSPGGFQDPESESAHAIRC